MALASKIRAIKHDIDAPNFKIDIAPIAFIKALYPTYSHYLESLQASGKIKSLDFGSLVEKIVERENDFAKKIAKPIRETMCLAQGGNK